MSAVPDSRAETSVASRGGARGRPAGRPPPSPLRGPAGVIFRIAGVVAAVGAFVALAVPTLGLSSTDCGALSCGLVQTTGKVLASAGVAVALATIAVQSLRTRQFSAAVLAALIAGPALLWSVMIADQWRRLDAGTDEASTVLAVARDYAGAQGVASAADLRLLIYNGRGEWISVKATTPTDQTFFVLERREGGGWVAKAVAPTFSRADLRALGAPTDLLKDPG